VITGINHTQISNDFLDKYMNILSGNAVKLFLAIARKTIGWHKETDIISDSQIVSLTSLSINTIKKARQELLDLNIIIFVRKGSGKSTKTFYEINYNNMKSNISNFDISNFNVSNFDTKNSFNVSNFDTKNSFNVSKFDSTKESNIKKKNIKKDTLSDKQKKIEEIYQLYPTRDLIQKYSTGKCQKNRLQINNLLKKYSKNQIKESIENYIEERKNAKLSIKTFSRFLDEFPEPEPEYDIENMSVKEVERLMELGKI
jgi:phage replication O-like protein O